MEEIGLEDGSHMEASAPLDLLAGRTGRSNFNIMHIVTQSVFCVFGIK